MPMGISKVCLKRVFPKKICLGWGGAPIPHHFRLTFPLVFLGATVQYEFWPQIGEGVSSQLEIHREDILPFYIYNQA